MSLWELRTKSTDEVVGDIDIYETMETTSGEIARAYFLNKKQLDEKEFDTIFKITPKTPIGGYKWWKEENMRLDDF
jgi:hypothetical protein|tara:strand:+ start:67 stop:294 length:228 start_codon:yes stop_codon:yes gene_type:complete